MSDPVPAPCGSWRSPITTEFMVGESVRLGSVCADREDVYWLEGRPAEGGRYVLVQRTKDGVSQDLTPSPYNVRTRIHEYGGAPYLVQHGQIWFCNDSDQRIYFLDLELGPRPLTAPGPYRYADFSLDERRARLICVREHHVEGAPEPVNEIVTVGLNDGEVTVLLTGHDFYSNPRISPDGRGLVFLCWDHPNMPWDGTRLYSATLSLDGNVGGVRTIAGGDSESVFQPEWSPAGEIYFVSDRNGWWNIYRVNRRGVRGQGADAQGVQCVLAMEAEFGLPQWVFGMRTYGFDGRGRVVCLYAQNGFWHLGHIDPSSGNFVRRECPFTHLESLAVLDNHGVLLAGSPVQASAVVLQPLDDGALETLRDSAPLRFSTDYLSPPEAVRFPTTGGMHAHGFFYPPTNPDYSVPQDERPPLIVLGHGGPTGATSTGLSLAIQFWTSRGFAVLDVNYRGSTGYGRTYRELLKGEWGIVDVEDCIRGAQYLVDRGEVDEKRLIIRGSSAGGYTVLAALTFHDRFTAGASYYGISDLETLAQDTHKFESRYTDQLVGPYPETRETYVARSPIHFVQQLNCPVIFFQGLEDKIVPPDQAQTMADALADKGVPVAHLTFEGEQHGFRKGDTIRSTLHGELYFYGRVFGFSPADSVPRIEIRNLA